MLTDSVSARKAIAALHERFPKEHENERHGALSGKIGREATLFAGVASNASLVRRSVASGGLCCRGAEFGSFYGQFTSAAWDRSLEPCRSSHRAGA